MGKLVIKNIYSKRYKFVIFEADNEKVVHFSIIYNKIINDNVVNGKVLKAPVLPGYKNATIPIGVFDIEKMINLEYTNKIKPKF